MMRRRWLNCACGEPAHGKRWMDMGPAARVDNRPAHSAANGKVALRRLISRFVGLCPTLGPLKKERKRKNANVPIFQRTQWIYSEALITPLSCSRRFIGE